MTEQEKINRAAKVQAWLNDAEFLRAFTVIEEGIFDKFRAAPIRDTEALIACKTYLNLLNNLKACFEQTVADGKFAAETLKLRK